MNTLKSNNTKRSAHYLASGTLAVFVGLFPQWIVAADNPVLSDSPIANTTSSEVKPNIMLLMDTSNSMRFSHMPDEIEGNNNQAFPIGYKSYQCNILYYKPTQTYELPKNSVGDPLPLPTFGAAFYNAYAQYKENPLTIPSDTRNLASAFQAYDSSTRRFTTVADLAQPAYYYIYSDASGNIPELLNYAAAPCTDIDQDTSTPASTTGTWTRVLVSSLSAAQQKNFAIWYSYYRTRISMIKSAVSLSFTPLTDKYRVGFITAKPYQDNPATDPTRPGVPPIGATVSSDYYLPINDFSSATGQRQNWFAKVFSQVPGGSSPAREGLARVGRHYAGKQDSINLGMTGDPVQYSCQQNFTIMTTDGYWNTAAETLGPVKLDGSTHVGQQDGTLNQTKADPNSLTGTINITPRPIWDGYADTTRVTTAKNKEYQLVDCISLYSSMSTQQNLRSTAQNLQSTIQMQQSTSQNLQNTAQNLRSTAQNLQSTTQMRIATVQNLRNTSQNLRSTVQNLQNTSQNLQTSTQTTTRTEQITRNTTQNLRSTTQNRQSTTQMRIATVQNLQNTTQNLQSTVQNLQTTTQYLKSTSQWFSYDSRTELSTPVATCTNSTYITCTHNITTNIPVATCVPQTATSGNLYLAITCTSNTTGPTPVASCAPVSASSSNSYTTTTCGTNNTTNVPVASCAASGPTAANGYTTTTCTGPTVLSGPTVTASCTPIAASSTNGYVSTVCGLITSTTPVATCTPQSPTAANGYTTITCSTNNTTNVPVAVCTPQSPTAANGFTTITCPAPITTTNVPAASCTASGPTAGNTFITTTCSTNNTSNVPVASCAASGPTAANGYTTTTCPAPATTGPTGVASCSPITATAGNNWTATTCTPNNTSNVAVASCTASGPTAANGYTTTSCTTSTTTDEPVAACNASAPTAGNGYITTTCPSPITTFIPETVNCVAAAASASNSWTSVSCGPFLAGKEIRSRVSTSETTEKLSGTSLITSSTAATVFDPPSGFAATDGICVPINSTLVAAPTLPIGGALTTIDSVPPAVPADTATTTYTSSCTNGSWPCVVTTVTQAGSRNSLADIAQYYYVTDLRTGSAWDSNVSTGGSPVTKNDNVPAAGPGSEDDNAPWQHMTTYSIALGVSGTVNYSKTYKDDTVGDFASLRSGTKAWPIWPDTSLDFSNGALYSDPRSIDDFWHTAVDGRGRYFSAGKPADVVEGLRTVLRDLGTRQGAGSASAASSPNPVQGDNLTFAASYATSTWAGDLVAREIDLATGSPKSQILWRAQPLLDAKAGLFCDNRKIYLFRSGATNNMVDFKWNTGTCSSESIAQNSSVTVTTAGAVTAVSLDTITYPDPLNPPTVTAKTGSAAPRKLLVGDAVLAGDLVVTSAGAAVEIEHIVSPTTTLNASEQAYFNASKVADLSQYPDMSDGTDGTPNQRALADDDNLVNFIRGHRGHEGFVPKDAVKFYRKRASILGDFVTAQPVYVKAPFARYADTGYTSFKELPVVSGGQADRKGMVYAAANDGMLHAFYAGAISVDSSTGATTVDSTGGQEAWAFMPSAVLDNLYKLANSDYQNRHTFSVDGTPSVGDVFDSSSSAWKTILVAGLNKGGKGYYALDVTDPDNPKALWEFKWSNVCYSLASAATHDSDCHIGYTFGRPIITKLTNGTWVVLVTSGYNNVSGQSSGDGQGYLYALNAMTGKIISKIATGAGNATIPSGLAQINNFVDNALINNTTKFIFGGDNQGNIWRFTIDEDPGNPAATPPIPSSITSDVLLLGTAKDTSGNIQPITTRPELGEISGKPWVFIGTGRLLGSPDLTDVNIQSVYGFVAESSFADSTAFPDGLRGVLRPHLISPKTASNANPAVGATRTVSCTGSASECDRASGWVVDLPDDGERVNVDMALQFGTLVFASNVPRNTACNIGGYSWFNALDFRTGLPVKTRNPDGSTNTTTSQFAGDFITVGVRIYQLPPPGSSSAGGSNGGGQVVGELTGGDGNKIILKVLTAIDPPSGRRVSWREILQ